jgi:cell division protein ZapA (FtsZ GTPase activity inhibitor)
MVKIYSEAFSLFCNGEPPHLDKLAIDALDHKEFLELQEWSVNNAKVTWMTGIGIIEAVDSLVYSAVENGNIKGVEDVE